MRLFKRNDIWYAQFYENGSRVQRSTKCTDKSAAHTVATLWERDAADPDNARLRDATLSDVLQLLLQDREERANAGRASSYTVSFYAVQCGHLTRVLEHDARGEFVPFPLAKLKAYDVDRFISRRRAEGASESTIAKNIIGLRAALKIARRAGLWRGDPAEVCPIASLPSTNRANASSDVTTCTSCLRSSQATARQRSRSWSPPPPNGARSRVRSAAT